jgi:hypothetical protein
MITEPAGPEDEKEAEAQVAQDLDGVAQYAQTEQAITREEDRFATLRDAWQQATGVTLPAGDLDEEEARLFEELLADPEHLNVSGLAERLVASRRNITEMQDELARLRGELPVPDVVESGDSHLKLAINYLTNTVGYNEEKAREIAQRSMLVDQILPGMEVWHFHREGVYGTAVTQGTAETSPWMLARNYTTSIVRERDAARKQAGELKDQVDLLEERRSTLEGEVSSMEDRISDLSSQQMRLQSQYDTEKDRWEASRFTVSHIRDLRKREVLTVLGLRIKDWPRDEFDRAVQPLDTSFFLVTASEAGIGRINHLDLLPAGVWDEGIDYELDYTADRGAVTVRFLDPAAFAGENFVVAIR